MGTMTRTTQPRAKLGVGRSGVVKHHTKNWTRRRASILVAGMRGVVRLPQALVAPTAERTIISPKVARQVANSLGPVRSVHLGEHAKIKGPTTKVAVAIDGYTAVDVTAVVTDMLPGEGATVGADVLKRAVRVRH
jgi:hypothetical protein